MILQEVDMYFGLNKPDGEKVSMDDFNHFVNKYILDFFPDFTLIHVYGYWKKESEESILIKVMTNKLDSVFNKDRYEFYQNIQSICSNYCTLFEQECVMVTNRTIEKQLYGIRL